MSPQSAQPIRVLCVIPNPSDLAPFDAGRAWQAISSAFQQFLNRGITIERAPTLTESGLRDTIGQNRFEVIYFLGHATARGANYSTLALLAFDGSSARQIVASSAASLFCDGTGVRLVLLQAATDSDFHFEAIAQAISARGLPAVIAPRLGTVAQQALVTKLFSGVLASLPAEAVAQQITGIQSDDLSSHAQLIAPQPHLPVIEMPSPPPQKPPADWPTSVSLEYAFLPGGVAPPTPAPAPAPLSATPPPPAPPAWQEKLKAKRATGMFDVFLCHNSADKPAVINVAQQLKQAGILPWLDRWELQPGQPWQRALERQIDSIHAAAVFVGSAGIGPWQEQEIDGFLREFVDRNVPVIPILLPNAPATPVLPVFLRAMTWVDFRQNDPDPLTQLLWGITGQRPDL